jgi:flagellar hook-associated protein 1 FlgK
MSLLVNGLSGLLAAQHALNVSSQNTANINTPGYSRQEALLAARQGNSFGRLDAGSGVSVLSLRRVTDGYLTAAVWRNTSQQGFDSQYQQLIGYVEQVFGSDQLGVTAGLDSFYAALNSAADAPQSIAPRQQILATAKALANRFNQLSANLDLQSRQIDEQSDALLAEANTRLSEVAKLNRSIVETLSKGGNVAALEDQRDQAVEALSKLVQLQVNRQQDGSLSLSLATGQALVLGGSAASLSRAGDVFSATLGNQTLPLVGSIGGTLGALIAYRRDELQPLRAALDTLATDIADGVNNQLAAGFDLQDPAQAGGPLFGYDPLNPAGSLQLAAGISAEGLACAGGGGGPGDNRNLLALLEQKDSFYSSYVGILGGLAVRSGQAAAEAKASSQLQQDAVAQRDSVSGVNLDEEAMQLMRYMQAYQANAKVVGAADQLFDTLLSMF